MDRITKIVTIAVTAFVSACSSGGITPPDNTCKVNCSQVETVSVVITSPSQGSVVLPSFTSYPTIMLNLTASASSNISSISNLAWTIDDQSVVIPRVEPGTHKVCVTAISQTSKSAATCNTFSAAMPTMAGTLKSISSTLSFPIQDIVPKGGIIAIGDVGMEDVVQVGLDGKWSLQTRWALKDTVKIWPSGEGMLSYNKPILVLKNDFSAVNIVTAPAVVTIPTGSFANQQVVISLDKARALSGDSIDVGQAFNTGFYITRPGARVGSYTSYPQATAFCRGLSNTAIAVKDSTALWTQLNDVNFVFGRQLFKPANENEVCPMRTGMRVIVDVTKTRNSGSVDNIDGFNFIGGVMIFRNTDQFSTPEFQNYVTHHEPFHALGFGHTCSWSSVMYANCTVTPQNPTAGQLTISREDVAYALFMMAIVDEMRKLNTSYSILTAQP